MQNLDLKQDFLILENLNKLSILLYLLKNKEDTQCYQDF